MDEIIIDISIDTDTNWIYEPYSKNQGKIEMKIEKSFNRLSFKECIYYIDHHKKYTDFNVLGLYRSISENEKLNLEEKLELRDYAHQFFKKSFDFLQVKDPDTFYKVSTLGMDLTKADEVRFYDVIRQNQQRILSAKRISHRNFGVYSKHNCNVDWCSHNGTMIKQGSFLTEDAMHFDSDKNKSNQKKESKSRKNDHKKRYRIVNADMKDVEETLLEKGGVFLCFKLPNVVPIFDYLFNFVYRCIYHTPKSIPRDGSITRNCF